MTTLFDLDFANESVGAYLQNIDSNWSRQTGVNFAVTAGHRLAPYQYSGATYSYTQDGVIHWELDVYADDVSNAGPAWYIGVGTNGSDVTTGAYVQYRFADNLWRIYEGTSVIGTVSDDWWSQGNTRRLILDWDPTAGTLTLTVMDGTTTVGSSTVNGVTPDGNKLCLAAKWNDVSYTTITLSGMMATDGAGSAPDASAAVSGALDDIVGAASVQVFNPVSATVSGALGDIAGQGFAQVANPASASIAGQLDGIAGGAAIAVTDGNAVVISGILDDILGGVSVSVSNPAAVLCSGQLGDIAGAAGVGIFNPATAEVLGQLGAITGAAVVVIANPAVAAVLGGLGDITGRAAVMVGDDAPLHFVDEIVLPVTIRRAETLAVTIERAVTLPVTIGD